MAIVSHEMEADFSTQVDRVLEEYGRLPAKQGYETLLLNLARLRQAGAPLQLCDRVQRAIDAHLYARNGRAESASEAQERNQRHRRVRAESAKVIRAKEEQRRRNSPAGKLLDEAQGMVESQRRKHLETYRLLLGRAVANQRQEGDHAQMADCMQALGLSPEDVARDTQSLERVRALESDAAKAKQELDSYPTIAELDGQLDAAQKMFEQKQLEVWRPVSDVMDQIEARRDVSGRVQFLKDEMLAARADAPRLFD